jgi:hypothetical protein
MDIIIQAFFILLLFVFFVFFVVQFFNICFRGFAPFISTRPKVIAKIISELKMRKDATVYELGCGRAGFLRALRKKYPQAKLIGIEYSFLPYLLGQIQNSFTGCKLKIIKKNFLKVDLSRADVIYCYLNEASMKALEGKFNKECKSGTVIISYMFSLPNMKSEKELAVRNEKDKVYFYRI